MSLPNLQYIQTVEVYSDMAEVYQQFLRKMISAHKASGIKNKWTVYENTMGIVRTTREFIFIRALDNWAQLDEIAKEDPLTKIMLDIYGETDSLQWMKVAQKSVKKITTSVISRNADLSLD
ncbi:MAG: hypothetical protein IH840_15800 [Candidatus Heimdallarchaeota archaeon]|nr:hypothetical protein [Candidatus Heimdallarchaeota archaeon]